MARIDHLLAHMVARGASDLHLSAGAAPVLRLHGHLHTISANEGTFGTVLSERDINALLHEIVPAQSHGLLERRETFAFSYEPPGSNARFRINIYTEHKGVAAAIRYFRKEPPVRLADLGLPRIVPDLSMGHTGLVLIVGATGSGKSTTLAACVNEINESAKMHIITLEQPIEYTYVSRESVIHQREIGVHAPNYEAAIHSALQQDPDVIVVGEMRSAESMRLALIAAETGHLVLTTLHSSSAAKAVERVLMTFRPEERDYMRSTLADSLRCVVHQRLIRTSSGDGRVPAVEILVNTPAVAAMIRNGESHKIESTMQSSKRMGMITMSEAIARLILSGRVDEKDAREKAPNLRELDEAMNR